MSGAAHPDPLQRALMDIMRQMAPEERERYLSLLLSGQIDSPQVAEVLDKAQAKLAPKELAESYFGQDAPPSPEVERRLRAAAAEYRRAVAAHSFVKASKAIDTLLEKASDHCCGALILDCGFAEAVCELLANKDLPHSSNLVSKTLMALAETSFSEGAPAKLLKAGLLRIMMDVFMRTQEPPVAVNSLRLVSNMAAVGEEMCKSIALHPGFIDALCRWVAIPPFTLEVPSILHVMPGAPPLRMPVNPATVGLRIAPLLFRYNQDALIEGFEKHNVFEAIRRELSGRGRTAATLALIVGQILEACPALRRHPAFAPILQQLDLLALRDPDGMMSRMAGVEKYAPPRQPVPSEVIESALRSEPNTVPVRTCSNAQCGKTGTLRVCARCKQAAYCSRECQMADWKARHKHACKELRAAPPS